MGKMFGTYFHSLLIHAPCQYEIVSLSSVNTEKQERLFGQARAAASSTSNRQPENVMKSILLHLQSRALAKASEGGTTVVDSRVSKLSKQICPNYKGTSIPQSFIESRPSSSWQAHLERIAPFLMMGPGYWWEEIGESVNFHDGDDDENYDKPQLLHFRSSQISAAADRSKEAWDNILQQKVCIPTTLIKMYDSKGDVISTWNPSGGRTPEVTPSVMISESSSPSCILPEVTSFPPMISESSPLHEVLPCASPEATSFPPMISESSPLHEVLPCASPEATSFPPMISESSPLHQVLPCASPPSDVVINAKEFMVPEVSGSVYKTKLAKALAQLLGSSDELKKLDEIRINMKMKKTKRGVMEHDEILAKFQTLVLKERTDLKKQLSKSKLDDGPDYKELYTRYKLSVRLLRSWNIIL